MSQEKQDSPLSSVSLKEANAIHLFLDSQKAKDIEIINIDSADGIADMMIIAGASSKRHAQGLADGIIQLCKENNFEFLGMEGYDLADWILIDCNNIIINIFQEEPRKLYKLEDLWRRSLHKKGDSLS